MHSVNKREKSYILQGRLVKLHSEHNVYIYNLLLDVECQLETFLSNDISEGFPDLLAFFSFNVSSVRTG